MRQRSISQLLVAVFILSSGASFCFAQIDALGLRFATAKPYDLTVCLAFSPDSRKILACNNQGPVTVFQPPLGQKLGVFFSKKFVSQMVFSPQGGVVAGHCAERPDVFLLDDRDWKLKGSLQTANKSVNFIAFSSDGKYLAAACTDRSVFIWHFPTRRLLHEVKVSRSSPAIIQISPDSRLLAIASASIEFYDLDRGVRSLTIPIDPDRYVGGIAFLDGGRLCAASVSRAKPPFEAAIQTWDTTTGVLKHSMGTGDECPATLIPIAEDRLITGSFQSGMIRLWEPKASRQVASFSTGANLGCLTLSPDCRVLACTLAPSDLRIWKVSDVFPEIRLPQ